MQVVPTVYTDIRGRTIPSNQVPTKIQSCLWIYCFRLLTLGTLLMQFSVTEHFKSAEMGYSRMIPGVFFYYDLSPIKVFSSSSIQFCFKCRHYSDVGDLITNLVTVSNIFIVLILTQNKNCAPFSIKLQGLYKYLKRITGFNKYLKKWKSCFFSESVYFEANE